MHRHRLPSVILGGLTADSHLSSIQLVYKGHPPVSIYLASYVCGMTSSLGRPNNHRGALREKCQE